MRAPSQSKKGHFSEKTKLKKWHQNSWHWQKSAQSSEIFVTSRAICPGMGVTLRKSEHFPFLDKNCAHKNKDCICGRFCTLPPRGRLLLHTSSSLDKIYLLTIMLSTNLNNRLSHVCHIFTSNVKYSERCEHHLLNIKQWKVSVDECSNDLWPLITHTWKALKSVCRWMLK